MDDAAAEKVGRNDAAFREANDEIEAAAEDYGLGDGRVVPFLCECSDEQCSQIIRLTLAEYRRARGNPRWFVHAPQHEQAIPGVVRLLEEHERYSLVEKLGHAGDVAAEIAANGETHERP
jgi:hypothetical protein